ncbi:LOW QUALITY PROTEIN: hypothetical protein PFUGPA_04253 [Plasmodium falciparum Palo Alto/Uganda]|uniref:Uncharacterized protein n=5 Tax=Plasmodium falciparum TaxID=5833 RepID=W4IWL5_PLAFP|nr:LOW QUALITY PROTEIN: hypothetical protein PFFVO_05366 [Plasmodium falciparum Vietnam Oak-Knoll (FVO)]ETW33574.1 LOW QUALITY PROTEIN: hypothetical protein PFTANZ_05700 [Plasmodium falciparum Tanzania (2000708)]ETW39514.1 LOW QUALITY PROTEIN: hypothetical protein PFNF135_05545 [Plasmodium falciparum NF135/5.C10]ETW54385.1 LOW QUALITY PROTEIN: hypothetical protein PFUGPA_04253 [Plasmodium falciparum Palo Alto/Uganda]EUR62079.1 LOW QUALITY PROTEIN: hypothetical protein PFBG_05794 [Plasmodium fal
MIFILSYTLNKTRNNKKVYYLLRIILVKCYMCLQQYVRLSSYFRYILKLIIYDYEIEAYIPMK